MPVVSSQRYTPPYLWGHHHASTCTCACMGFPDLWGFTITEQLLVFITTLHSLGHHRATSCTCIFTPCVQPHMLAHVPSHHASNYTCTRCCMLSHAQCFLKFFRKFIPLSSKCVEMAFFSAFSHIEMSQTIYGVIRAL